MRLILDEAGYLAVTKLTLRATAVIDFSGLCLARALEIMGKFSYFQLT
jgi:hypothetical protein